MVRRTEFDHIVTRLKSVLPTDRPFDGTEAIECAIREFQDEDFRKGFAVGLVVRMWYAAEEASEGV